MVKNVMLDQQSKTELSGTAEIDQMTVILNVQRRSGALIR